MPEAVIIECLRTAVGRSGRGSLRTVRPDDLAATVIRALLKRYPQVAAADIEEFTYSTTFMIMQSMRLDLGAGSQVHP